MSSTGSVVLDIERAIAGALLKAQTIDEAAQLLDSAGDLQPSHFRQRAAAETFRIAAEFVQRGAVPDPVSVSRALAAIGRGNAGAFVGALIDGLPRPHSLAPWADALRAEAAVRDNGAAGVPGPDDAVAEREPSVRDAAKVFAPVSVAELYDRTEDAVLWILHGLVPLGALVVLAAFMKAGKTTLAYALIAAVLRGTPFLGRETRRTKVLLLALEENRRDVKRRLLKFGVERAAGLFVQFRPVPTTRTEWAALVEFVRVEGIGLIAIDTLARCWPVWGVDNENDNAATAAAMSPLLDLCHELQMTILLLHHTGKLDAGNGREVRGAGAILALADQALLFDRYRAGDQCDRIIKTLGRYDESPAETVIRYDKALGTYDLVGEAQLEEEARGAERLFPQVLTFLRGRKETGASMRDIRANVHGRATTKDQAVSLLIERGKVALRGGAYYHEDYAPDVS